MKIMLMLSVAGVVLLEVDSFSEEVALCLSFATAPLCIVLGDLYMRGTDVGIVGVMIFRGRSHDFLFHLLLQTHSPDPLKM